MIDRDMVLNGWEHCGSHPKCDDCLYNAFDNCTRLLESDIREILSEQPNVKPCKDCKHFYYGLEAVVDGGRKTVTPPRCSLWCGFTKEDGWCYKFEPKLVSSR